MTWALSDIDGPFLKGLELGMRDISWLSGVVREVHGLDRDFENSDPDFKKIDILELDCIEEYDLVLDAHLFHCLNGEGEFEQALKNCYHALNENGLLISEIAVRSKGLKDAEDFFWNEKTGALSTKDGTFQKWVTHERVIESYLIKSGFKIKKFMMSGRKLVPVPHRDHICSYDPDVLWVVAQKSD